MKVKTITCPNCNHANNFLAEECTQCGINFSRYYEELEKAESLRRHIEEQEKAEALKREQEEQARQEAETRQREEEMQAEALRRQQEAEARLEAEARRQAEEERRQQEAEQKRLEEERQREAQKRADMLRRQKEELEKAEALKREKEAQARQEAEAQSRQAEEEEQRRLEEERRQRAAEAQERPDEEQTGQAAPADAETTVATGDHVDPEDDAAPDEDDHADTDAEAYAGAFDYIEYPPGEGSDEPPPETDDGVGLPPQDYRAVASLAERLQIYAGRMVGLTYGNPAEIQNVKLLTVSGDHFQVFYPISRNVVSFSYRAIVSITENAEGLSAVGPDISPVFPVVIELPRPFFHNN